MKKPYLRFLRVAAVVLGLITSWTLPDLAQDASKPRLAIVDFSTTSQNSDLRQLENVVPEWLTTFFVKQQIFNVIERRQLEAILQEQTLGQTGLLDEQSAAHVGQVLGVDMLVTGTIISVADSLEVTARIVDVETGTILGIESVVADDVEALRDKIDVLGSALIKALGKEPAFDMEDSSLTREMGKFDSAYWEISFDENFPVKDTANTQWNWENGRLSLKGTYKGRNEDRTIWLTPLAEEAYTTIEMKFRVNTIEGAASVCAEAGWANDTMWAGICAYVEDDYSDVTLYIENEDDVEAEKTFDIDIATGTWYQIRVEYQADQFHFYVNDRLLTTLSADTPVSNPDGLWPGVSVYLEETTHLFIEFDTISVR